MSTAVQELVAGKELDRMVAFLIFGKDGFEPCRVIGYDGVVNYDGYVDSDGCNVPCYSTDIAAAFLLLEPMSHDGFDFRLEYDDKYGIENRAGWSVTYNGVVFAQFEKTAPLAICKAFLAARENGG